MATVAKFLVAQYDSSGIIASAGLHDNVEAAITDHNNREALSGTWLIVPVLDVEP